VIVATLVVTASSEEEFERVRAAARGQLAFYGSTPAYRPTLDCHGWGDLQPELNRLSKEGRWSEMAALVDDDVLGTIAVVGEPHTIAPQIVARLDGIADAVSITHNRAPDPDHWAPVVEALRNGR
jgi:alkanesulfonate monooxygenase SsuD/methylene tetrahydromethanopterin reductase-like flavin-dependent oxidoreductase (luciferase family)